MEPEKAPEAISRAVASLPPEQMYELMKQMKVCIQNNPNEARNMLLQNPQLAYALLQAQIIMKIVDPQVAMTLLHRPREVPPVPAQPPANPYVAAPVPAPQAPNPVPVAQPAPHMNGSQVAQQQAPPPPAQPAQPRLVDPRMVRNPPASSTAAPPTAPVPATTALSMSAAGGDQERQALIMQVMSLRPEQIEMLPPEQRQSIMLLKDQISKGQF